MDSSLSVERMISERTTLITSAIILAFTAHHVARWAGFWKLQNTGSLPKSSAIYFFVPLLLAYLIFLGLQLIVIGLATLSNASAGLSPWFGILATLLSSLGVWAFTAILPQEYKEIIWGKTTEARKNFLLGVVSWLMAYPMVLFVGQVVSATVWLIEPQETPDQVAVRQIRAAENSPYLLGLYFPLIVFIVPVAEEILFRGFLQSWLRSFLSFFPALILASLIFALCHFSISQGIANWELLTSLFVLSLYLGFLYEKQKTIWASIGLHSVFNAVSMFFILFLE